MKLQGVASRELRKWLEKLYRERFKSWQKMADCLGYANRQSVKQIVAGSGERIDKIPLDRIPQWADGLGLEGDKRAHFVRLAQLDYAPVETQADYLAMRRGLQRTNKAVAELSVRVDELAQDRARLLDERDQLAAQVAELTDALRKGRQS